MRSKPLYAACASAGARQAENRRESCGWRGAASEIGSIGGHSLFSVSPFIRVHSTGGREGLPYDLQARIILKGIGN